MENMKVTSLDQLREYGTGAVVELPPFSDNQPFVVRLRRPNATELLVNGGVPNELLHTAFVLFQVNKDETKEDKTEVEELEDMKNTHKMLQFIAKHAMVEPTYQSVADAGLELTDAQLIAIYTYVQTGVKKLTFFREKQQEDREYNCDGETVQ